MKKVFLIVSLFLISFLIKAQGIASSAGTPETMGFSSNPMGILFHRNTATNEIKKWNGTAWVEITGILKVSNISITQPAIGLGGGTVTATTTVTGAAVGDAVMVNPRTALAAGMSLYYYVSATNTVTIAFVKASSEGSTAYNFDVTVHK